MNNTFTVGSIRFSYTVINLILDHKKNRSVQVINTIIDTTLSKNQGKEKTMGELLDCVKELYNKNPITINHIPLNFFTLKKTKSILTVDLEKVRIEEQEKLDLNIEYVIKKIRKSLI